jgi:UDP-glucose 4-epimerase
MLVDEAGKRLVGREVLVTGATGFIGSHLAERLVALGARVTAVGPSLGWRPTVPTLIQQGRVRFVRLEAFWSPASVNRVKREFEDAEYLVHLGYAMPRGENPLEKTIDEIRRNMIGTMRFMGQLPFSVFKVCFASSAMVYGSFPSRPVTENDCAHPATAYAVGKLATEAYLRLYAKESGVPVSILRYATVYGPMETVPRAIPNFVRQVLAGGSPIIYGRGDDVRDYVHVLDVIDATLLALTQDDGVQVYNVGTGKGYTAQEIAERIIGLAGKRVKPVHKAAQHESIKLVCDIARAQRRLGYEPKVELDQGLTDEIRYFANNPKLWRKL